MGHSFSHHQNFVYDSSPPRQRHSNRAPAAARPPSNRVPAAALSASNRAPGAAPPPSNRVASTTAPPPSNRAPTAAPPASNRAPTSAPPASNRVPTAASPRRQPFRHLPRLRALYERYERENNRQSNQTRASTVRSAINQSQPRLTLRERPRPPPAHPANHISGTSRPNKFAAILKNPPLDQETLEKYSWNPDDTSTNISVKDDDKLTLHREPIASSTDAIRGKFGYTKGFHVWKITWPVSARGTHAVIGVATKTAPLQHNDYVSLVGRCPDSFGWDLTRNKCGYDSEHAETWTYPNAVTQNGQPYVAPNNIYCILDMDEGYMAFATDRNYLGVAFRDLQGMTLYPIVSCVWGHCEITMKYLGGLEPEPRHLMDACRNSIISTLGNENDLNDRIKKLPLPPSMKNFLMYLDGS